jgi:hypothetical protein
MKKVVAVIVYSLIASAAWAQCGNIYLSGFNTEVVTLTSSQVIKLISKPLIGADTCQQAVVPLGACSLVIFNKAGEPVGEYAVYGLFTAEQRKQIIDKITPGVKFFFDKVRLQTGRYLPQVTIMVK